MLSSILYISISSALLNPMHVCVYIYASIYIYAYLSLYIYFPGQSYISCSFKKIVGEYLIYSVVLVSGIQ